MMLTWGLTVAGFVVIAYYLRGWTKTSPSENPHAIIGIVSVGKSQLNLKNHLYLSN